MVGMVYAEKVGRKAVGRSLEGIQVDLVQPLMSHIRTSPYATRILF